MEDPVLNRSLEETRELQARWAQYRDFYSMAARGQQRVTAQAEMKFLELKSRIAMLHDGFMEKLQHEQKTGQNIMTIVGDCILLGRVPNNSDAEKQKFEFDWNECYMLITEQVGALEEEKERLGNISEKVYKAQKRKEEFQAKIHNFLHSANLKYALIAAGIFMVIYGIPAFGIFDYREFGKISATKPIYRIFTNKLYRPYLNHELEYLDREDIPKAEKVELPGSISAVTDEPLSLNYLIATELPSMLTGKSLQDARDLINKAPSVEFERFKAESQDTRFYWIFFKDPKDAKTLVGLIQDTVKGLKDNQREDYMAYTYVTRVANFVMIGRGKHPHHEVYPRTKYMLPETTPNLLRQ